MKRLFLLNFLLVLTACEASPAMSIAESDVPSCDDASTSADAVAVDALATDATATCVSAGHAPVIVRTVGLRNANGGVFVALFAGAADFAANRALRGGVALISGGSAQIAFADVPPGAYGVAVFHDENDNGQLDTNAFGIPSEGFGFSRDAAGTFGPPDFTQMRFDHTDDAAVAEIVIRATYY
jgi:uncharacterized protein (DUF2141 family)